ncbi:MAG: type III secretion system inner membrane ring subunit SctD [Endozoicomonadaceae bacterium]|nr:type III secretion system inner membrane ring subunit SctD [Endozoicomonadaceae bacterium]
MSKTIWFLKILSGAHIGAEIDLEVGKYTIGRNEDCDFILTDKQLADEQFTLSVSEDRLELETEHDTPFIINDESVGKTCQPEKHHIIQIASLNFVFGIPGEPLPDLSPITPSLSNNQTSQQQIEIHTEENENENENENKTETKKQHIDGKIPITEFNAMPSESTNKKQSSTVSRLVQSLKDIMKKMKISHYFQGNKKKTYYFILAIMLLSLVSYYVDTTQMPLLETTSDTNITTDSDQKQMPAETSLQKAKDILNALALSDIQLQYNNGFVILQGYIAKKNEYQALLQQFQLDNIPYKSNVIVLQKMLKSAQKTLNQNNLDLEVHLMPSPGSIRITGYIDTQKAIKELDDLLLSEVLGIEEVTHSIETYAVRAEAVTRSLKQFALSWVKIVELPNEIILSGETSNTYEFQLLKTLISEFKNKYKDQPKIQLKTKLNPIKNKDLNISLNIKSISVGRNAYIILSNNEKYIVGAKLTNGYILESIGLDYLVLRLDNQRIQYNVRK